MKGFTASTYEEEPMGFSVWLEKSDNGAEEEVEVHILTDNQLTAHVAKEVAKARAEELETVIKELRNSWCFCTPSNNPCTPCEIAQHLEAAAVETTPKAEKGGSDD